MKKRWKRVVRTAGLVLAGALILVLGSASYLYFHKPALKGYIERTLSKRAGTTVTIGRLDYRLFPLRVEADSARIVLVSVLGRLEIEAGRVQATGHFDRVLSDKKPYLDEVAISGLKVDFAEDPNSPPSGPVDVKGLSRMLSGYLAYASRVTIKDASLHLGLPVEGMDLAAGGVAIAGVGGDRDSLAMSVERFEFRNFKPAAVLSAGFNAEAGWTRADPFLLDGTVDLAARSAALPGKNWQSAGFALKAGFRTDGARLSVGRFDLGMPGLVALSGSAEAGLGKNAGVAVTSVLDLTSLAAAKEAFAAFLPPDLPALSVDGALRWEGEVRGAVPAGGAPKVGLKGDLRLLPTRVKAALPGLSIGQTLRATVRLEGMLPDLAASGTIEGSGGEAAANSLRASGVSFRLPFEFRGGRLGFKSLTARAAKAALRAAGRTIELDAVSLTASGRVDAGDRSAVLDSLSADIPGLGRFDISGTASPGPRPAIALDARGRDIDMARVVTSFPTVVPTAFAAWQPGGLAGLTLAVRSGPKGGPPYRLKGTCVLTKGAFQDATGTIVAEGLEPRLEFDTEVSSAAAPVRISAALDLAAGETLWKDAYFNWKSEPVRLEIKGEYDPRAGAVGGGEAALTFAPVGSLRARGSVFLGPPPRFDVHLSAPAVDLATLYAFLAKMNPARPAALEVEGRADVEADLRVSGGKSISGLARVRGAAVARKDGTLALSGLEADLPFSLSEGAAPAETQVAPSSSPGYVRLKDLKTPALSLPPLRLDFEASRNLFVAAPAAVELWGAKLSLGRTSLSVDPAGGGVTGVSRLALSELDLAKLPFQSPSFKLSGRLSVPEGELFVGPKEVRFDGRVLASLFGGRMTLDRLRLTDLLTPGMRVMFDAQVEGLNLGRLTDSVPFGEVTGVVDVSLKGFVLSYGQPESFALTVRSVPTRGVSQKFSVKAVDNLSVISSGGPSAAPSSNFLTRLVHSFNYSRIGIACSLRNDVFTLQGTIVENGVQYLVRRATFFGIDVVNAKPVNTISFKDMLGRLQRVGQSQEKK
ncbi:MAG TPA: hypothetical protein VMS75_04610 [Terriglobales bacterium]|nr:hypothetical protein [Terriglobales bacterium]